MITETNKKNHISFPTLLWEPGLLCAVTQPVAAMQITWDKFALGKQGPLFLFRWQALWSKIATL